jgi:glutamate--cysteine ligase
LSGPTPDSPEVLAPITDKAQLIGFLARGARPKEQWKIGTEHEKFPFLTDTLKPVPYAGERSIRRLLEGMRDSFGWTPVMEDSH